MWDRIKLRIPMKIGDVVLKVTMERRMGNDRDTEIAEALAQIGEIVRLRLEDMA